MPEPDSPTPADPSTLARFGGLELIARLVVEGVMSGLHRSPFKGFSVEFAEHRQYGPGDEIRHIDWRAHGKTDRYFVKEFEEETNLKAYLVLDASGSMGYAGRSGSKLDAAKRLAASLAYLMISQRDAVGLVSFDVEARELIPPRSAPGHFSTVRRAIEETRPGGEASLARVLRDLAERIRRRGLIIILSDGFDDLDELTASLKHLRLRRHEVLFFQILAPEEEEFPFKRATLFQDLERPGRAERVDPVSLREGYLRRFRMFRESLRENLLEMNAVYHKVSTAESTERVLLDYLTSRSRRARGAGS